MAMAPLVEMDREEQYKKQAEQVQAGRLSSRLHHLNHAVKAAGFLLMLAIPMLGPLGYWTNSWWLSPTVLFVLVPVMDRLVGSDLTNTGAREKRWKWYFWAIPYLYVMTWMGCLFWTAETLSFTSDPWKIAGLLLAAGIGSGFATCAAHELLHRGSAADYWTSRITMAICCYGHFVVEHLHHHATVGRIESGTTPIVGESMWRFVARNAAFGLRNAYQVSERLRKNRQKGWLSNRSVQQHLFTMLVLLGVITVWGAIGAGLFLAQGALAIFTVEFVQYCAHYGLSRPATAPITVRHSWNSNGWLTNAITLNITRHSEHHIDARIPYQSLRAIEAAPGTPCGYFGLFWITLVPGIWVRFIKNHCNGLD